MMLPAEDIGAKRPGNYYIIAHCGEAEKNNCKSTASECAVTYAEDVRKTHTQLLRSSTTWSLKHENILWPYCQRTRETRCSQNYTTCQGLQSIFNHTTLHKSQYIIMSEHENMGARWICPKESGYSLSSADPLFFRSLQWQHPGQREGENRCSCKTSERWKNPIRPPASASMETTASCTNSSVVHHFESNLELSGFGSPGEALVVSARE